MGFLACLYVRWSCYIINFCNFHLFAILKVLCFCFQILKRILAFEAVHEDQDFDKIWISLQNVTDRLIVPSFQDITNMFSNGESFLVDGDSLILSIMRNENYDSSNGGQLLHLVYLCERHLQLFTRKGGHFEVIFFNIWNEVWNSNPTLLLTRNVLKCHLKHNMSCLVHEFDSVCDPEFKVLLEKVKFGFLLLDFQMTNLLGDQFSQNLTLENLLFHIEVFYCLVVLSLGCVDISDVELNVSTLNAFYLAPQYNQTADIDRCLNKLVQRIKQHSSQEFKNKDLPNILIPCEEGRDVRHMVTTGAAVLYLTDETAPKPCEEWIKAFLLYSALVEILPLKFRGCPKVTVYPTNEFKSFVSKMHQYMNFVLAKISLQSAKYDFKSVPDFWHGNFFVLVMEYLNKCNLSQKDNYFGSEVLSIYTELKEEVMKVSKVPLENLPNIGHLSLLEKESVKENSTVIERQVQSFWPAQLIPTSCALTSAFCKDIIPQDLEEHNNEILQKFITKNSRFEERKHWHSGKAITDIFDRVIDKNMKNYDKKKKSYLDAKYANFMAIYGSSIEGRNVSTKPIVVKNYKYEKKSKPQKVSKSANKIREARQKEVELKNERSDQDMLKGFELKYRQYRSSGDYKSALTEVSLLVDNLKTEKYIILGLVKKAKVLWHLWEHECSNNQNFEKRDVTYAKKLFLVLREILKKSQHNELDESQSKLLGKYLYKMGFEKIAQMWNLPEPRNTDESLYIGRSWVEWQLVELGPELERIVSTEPDSRVEDFIPDSWQRELFDGVDRKQSILVVAPTSSGKTYASYYCMESVLREDNEGVVVYVAPTKALVNQVAATVYARFKNKQMPSGKSVYGVFTRDYRTNATNCQILVTVPQCLELLLLSPRRYDWVKRLRYIIFDEIHCLAGQAGGFSWESGLLLIQCPFLALSATIEQPEELKNWLQTMQDFKKSRDLMDGCLRSDEKYEVKLVVYGDRHADLKKHVYSDGTFQHIHPYAYLDSERVSKSGIPSSITLSPAEVYQLYKAIQSSNPTNQELQLLEPESFFSLHCSNGFISRNSVRNYEAKLKELLEDWATDDPENIKAILMQLNRSSLSKLTVSGNNYRYIFYNFIHFIRRLQQENMLPAILFSYNRDLVNSLFHRATIHFEHSLEICKEKVNEINPNILNKGTQRKMKEFKESKKMSNDVETDFRISRRKIGKDKYEKSLGLMETENLRYFFGITVKQVGHADEKIVEFVENRLINKGFTRNDILPRGLRMGVGMHFGGMTAPERSAVEMLFRMKMLNIVFATGTLALGIHMPCKTVGIIGDSRYLNTLEFQQMSGRAGRRGFDITGNVVFMGVNERKMKSVLLGNLPKMVGNFPLSVTMVLRLLLLTSNVTSRGVVSEEAKQYALSR